ncbi:hypothetical protein MAHJHV65_35300 [Mycobacterium avium subsp. hominissuis]
MTQLFGGVCDRCGTLFRTSQFPNACLCRPCHLGTLSSVDRIVALLSGALS